MLPMVVARSGFGEVTKSQVEWAILWVFPTDSALYGLYI